MVDAAGAALPLALKDIAAMDKDGPDFRGDNVWSWQRWRQWLTNEHQRMNPVPGPAAIRGPMMQ